MKKACKTLACAVCTLLLVVTVAGATFSDTQEHWAKAPIERWSGYGVLKGSNGAFRPDGTITRAELASILNRILQYPAGAENSYSDIAGGDWYYQDFIALAPHGIIRSQGDKVAPNEAITREEAAFMVASAFGMEPHEDAQFSKLTDISGVSNWALSSVLSLEYGGYVKGNTAKQFEPQKTLTRAETVQILDNVIGLYITAPGTYNVTDETSILITSGDIVLTSSSTTIKRFYIAPSVTTTVTFDKTALDSWMASIIMVGTDPSILSYDKDHWSGSIYFTDIRSNPDATFAGGSGTSASPYQIATPDQFMQMLTKSAAKKGLYYALANDLTLTAKEVPSLHKTQSDDFSMRLIFDGHFDGQNHTITYETKSEYSSGKHEYVGLFPRVLGSVKNLNVKGSISVSGDSIWIVGGIVGSTLSTSSIDNCTSAVAISVKDDVDMIDLIEIGGITGLSETQNTISNCKSTGAITVNVMPSVNIGGIAGFNSSSSTIQNCSSSSKIEATSNGELQAGGICGHSKRATKIADCSFDADILVSAKNNFATVGGISAFVTNESQITQCRASGRFEVTANEGSICAGGIVGCMQYGVIQNCTAENLSIHAKNNTNFENKNTSEKIVTIMTTDCGGIVGQLISLASQPTSEEKLLQCTATNVNISSDGGFQSNAGGIYGACVYANAQIAGCSATGTVHAQGGYAQSDAGGIAGNHSRGHLSQSWADVAVTASGRPAYYFNNIGGLVGGIYEESTLKNCYSLGSVQPLDNADISNVGGLIGRQGDDAVRVSNCYTATDVSKANAATAVGSGTFFINLSNSFDLCGGKYGLCVVSIVNGETLLLDVSKEDARAKTTYADKGWDFNSTWKMSTSGTYKLPILQGVNETAQNARTMPSHLQ